MADTPVYGISLCGGALGLDEGLRAAIPGYRTIAVCEREADLAERMACRIEEGSLEPLAWWDDLGTFDGRRFRGLVDILTAGWPCQPHSVAGKRLGTADERWIWSDVARILDECQAPIFFGENVPGLLRDTHSDSGAEDAELEDSADDAIGGFGTVLRDLAGLGYDARWCCIRASDVGAAHRRKRVFILANRKDSHGWAGICAAEAGTRPNGIGRVGSSSSSSMEHARGGAYLGYATRGGLRERGQSPECPGQLDGADEGLGNPGDAGLEKRGRLAGNAGSECQTIERTGDELADAGSTERGRLSGFRGKEVATAGDGYAGSPIHIYGPGLGAAGVIDAIRELYRRSPSRAWERYQAELRNTVAWSDLLLRYPWMRPAISQAEIESDLCGCPDELVSLVVDHRTNALRAFGNGVFPLQAAVAFTELFSDVATRAGVTL